MVAGHDAREDRLQRLESFASMLKNWMSRLGQLYLSLFD